MMKNSGIMKACARTALAVILIVGLAGCASELTPRADTSTGAIPVAVFTGELVEGKPLYRLPRMEVVVSRSSFGPDS